MATCIPRVDGLSMDPLVWGVTNGAAPLPLVVSAIVPSLIEAATSPSLSDIAAQIFFLRSLSHCNLGNTLTLG